MRRHRIWAAILLGVHVGSCSFALSDEPEKKAPIPDAAAQAAALVEVKSVLASDYAKLPKVELAAKLIKYGQGTRDNPARRYVMFMEGGRAAVAAGDGQTICDTVDAIADRFQCGDPLEMKAKGLENAAKHVAKKGALSLFEFMIAFSSKAVDADNFDAAEQVLDACTNLARRFQDRNAQRLAAARKKEIGELRTEHLAAVEALAVLTRQPADPEANLTGGKYYAFTKGDWEKAVPMLALGSDAGLKAAAALDLARPSATDRQLKVADGWWALSEKKTGNAKNQLQARAAYWYAKAQSAVQDDFIKAKVQKRLEAAAKSLPPSDASALRSPTIINSIGMKLKLVPAGEFQMGSPDTEAGRNANEKLHRVRISKPFYLGIYPVTQGEYQRLIGRNPSWFAAAGGGRTSVGRQDTSRLPVEQVTWNDAEEFCRILSRKEGKTYRLPTEAEWEYACRAETSTPFAFGVACNGQQANCNGTLPYGTTTTGPNLQRTSIVGSYPPNAFGLYDMHGNVWQWCTDWFGDDYYSKSPADDPTGPTDGSLRVARGGSWRVGAAECRSAERAEHDPTDRSSRVLGFRVVREP